MLSVVLTGLNICRELIRNQKRVPRFLEKIRTPRGVRRSPKKADAA